MPSRFFAITRALIGALAIPWLTALAAPAVYAAEGPQRIVSLNVCTDELVLRLAEPARIASITWLSRQEGESNTPDLTSRVPINHGMAEEIVASRPDLVLAGAFTTRAAVALLKRSGLPVSEFGVPRNFDEVRSQIREAAGLLRTPDEAEKLIRDMDTRLSRISADPLPYRPTAVVLNPNGVTVGKGTLVDQIMTTAGLDNIAAALSFGSFGQIPLEVLALHKVDILIVSAAADGPPALATEILRHPILGKLKQMRIVTVPGRLWGCASPAVADAVEYLHAVAGEFRARVPR